jgi:hypothetical protein
VETNIWLVAAAWMALALLASPISIRIGISVALVEIVVGAFAGNVFHIHTTLLMSTGLTFGTISALFGLTNQIISQEQYTILVIAVIGSALIPTFIAERGFAPAPSSEPMTGAAAIPFIEEASGIP